MLSFATPVPALEIDEQDAQVLLAIRKGGCCGNPNPVPIFIAVYEVFMALVTGTPYGTITASESIYPTAAPYIYFQDYSATPMFDPYAESYYWQLSGTVTYPVYAFECVEGVSFTEGKTLNDVVCDNIGVVSTVEVRDYVEFQLGVKSIYPLSNLARMLNMSAATVNAGANSEKVGIGTINRDCRGRPR